MGGWPHTSTEDHAYLLEVVSTDAVTPLLDILAKYPHPLVSSYLHGVWDFLIATSVPLPHCHIFLFNFLTLFTSHLSL